VLLAMAWTVVAGSALAADPPEIALLIEKGKFQPDEIKVKANAPFILVITNKGDKAAEFESKDLRTEKVVPAGKTVKVRIRALNQYFIHARMCENWGYERLWKKSRSESIGEMRHADELIARILYLEGTPNVQKLGKVNVGQTVPEQLRLDLELEKAAVTMLNQAIETCRSLGDHGSRDLLEGILKSEEEHANWIEAQLTL